MKSPLLQRIKYSPLSRMATLPLRVRGALWPWFRHSARVLGYVAASREWADVPYNHEPMGIVSMAAALGVITGVDARTLRGYAQELIEDRVYVERHRQRLAATRLRYISDPPLRLGRGLFYYMLVRAAKSRLVFEAGTDKGFSSFAICRALLRNATEGGALGHLVTVDLASDRGDMLDDDEQGLVTRLTGDSVAHIAGFERPIDFFIHDTLSDVAHTRAQLQALKPRLSADAIVHTSWFTQEFVEFCERAGLAYLEVADRPLDHWYRGSRYGLAWRKG